MSSRTDIVETDVDVEDWIDGVSAVQARHTIYRNPAVFALYEPVIAEIDQLEAEVARLTAPPKRAAEETLEEASLDEEAPAAAPAGEESLDEVPAEPEQVKELRARLAALYDQAQALYDRYAKDVEVWTLRALDQPELVEAHREAGEPPVEPRRPSKDAKAAARTAYKNRYAAWLEAMAAYRDEVNLRGLALSVVSVEVAGTMRPAPSLEGLRRLKARPGGPKHVLELAEVMARISLLEVEIAAPHRPGA